MHFNIMPFNYNLYKNNDEKSSLQVYFVTFF